MIWCSMFFRGGLGVNSHVLFLIQTNHRREGPCPYRIKILFHSPLSACSLLRWGYCLVGMDRPRGARSKVWQQCNRPWEKRHNQRLGKPTFPRLWQPKSPFPVATSEALHPHWLQTTFRRVNRHILQVENRNHVSILSLS